MSHKIVNSIDLSLLMLKLKNQPVAVKVYVFQIYLLYQLRYLPHEEIVEFLNLLNSTQALNYKSVQAKIDSLLNSPELISNRVMKKLNQINQEVFDEAPSDESIYVLLDKLCRQLLDVNQKVLSVAKQSNKHADSLSQALDVIEQHAAEQKQAMYNAVEIIMDRLIDSLNPESSANYLDSNVLKVGPIKKAAMFDAIKDKYEQVQAYQKEGKMLRDFKVHYKDELKKTKKP